MLGALRYNKFPSIPRLLEPLQTVLLCACRIGELPLDDALQQDCSLFPCVESDYRRDFVSLMRFIRDR